MKLFFSCHESVETDGVNFYSNPLSVMLYRYGVICDEIICLTKMNRIKCPTHNLIEYPNVTFIEAPEFNNPVSLLSYYKVKRKITERLVECDICIVHVHTSFISTMTADAARELGIPCLHVVVGCAWDAMWNHSIKGKLVAPLVWWNLKRVQRYARYSIYVTHDFLQQRYPTPYKFIGCSNVELPANENNILDDRINQIECPKQRLKMATLAAIDVRYKGQQYVIKALALLRQQGIEMEYHLVGAGTGEYLRKVAKKNGVEDLVFLKGALPHSEIMAFLDTVDIYIQPSKQEGLPRSVVEAMSRGCLCVGSRIAGIPELLSTKYLFNAGNVMQIAKILADIDKDQLKEQAKRNIKISGLYVSSILNERRRTFLEEFRDESIQKIKNDMDKQKRVIHLLNFIKNGGAENVALNYSKVFSKLGYHSIFIAQKDSESYEKMLRNEGFDVEYKMTLNTFHAGDILFVHSSKNLLRLILHSRRLQKRGVRIVYIQHLFFSKWKFGLLSTIINTVCTDFIRITPRTKQLVQKYIHIPVYEIINFYINKYDFDQYSIIKKNIREALNIPENAELIMFSATFKHGKGLGDFLAIAGAFKDDDSKHFLIAGDGEERYLVEDCRLKNVSYIGRVNDVESYLIASDIYLFLSLFSQEMLPMALVEAINTDKKIIAYYTDINEFLLGEYTVGSKEDVITLLKKAEVPFFFKKYDMTYAIERFRFVFNIKTKM